MLASQSQEYYVTRTVTEEATCKKMPYLSHKLTSVCNCKLKKVTFRGEQPVSLLPYWTAAVAIIFAIRVHLWHSYLCLPTIQNYATIDPDLEVVVARLLLIKTAIESSKSLTLSVPISKMAAT